jgi:arylsulfatase
MTIPRETRRPNVLVVITDEERERAWWPDSVRLPARDRLAARGLHFTNHHVHAIPCSPSRATMLTGRHSHHNGVLDNMDMPWQGSMSEGLPTWGTLARSAGYTAAYHGKWHLSAEEDLRDASGEWSLERYGFEGWHGPDVHGAPWAGQRHDPRVAEQAAGWIAAHRHDADPWFCVASFVNPHDIMLYPRFRRLRIHDWGGDLPPHLHEDLSAKPRVHRRWREVCDLTGGTVRNDDTWRLIANAYIDLHVEVDRSIAVVLDALEASGLQDDTVVVFTSDHGDFAGAHGQRQKGAFVHAENVKVPLTVVWPGVVEPGTRCEHLSAAIDLTPTFAEIMQVSPAVQEGADLPGRSLVPLLHDRTAPVRPQVLFVQDAYSSIGPPEPTLGFLRGYTDGRWKYARYFLPGRQHAPSEECDLELYDLVEDPLETRNLAMEPARSGALVEHEAVLRELIEAELGEDVLDPPPPRLDRRLRVLDWMARRRGIGRHDRPPRPVRT